MRLAVGTFTRNRPKAATGAHLGVPSTISWAERQMGEFTTSWTAIPAPNMGTVIEFTFNGVHDWTHGPKIKQYIEAILSRESAAALIINWDGYTYEFGNDLFCVFITAAFDEAARRFRPVCVLAHRRTELALKSLFAANNTADLFDITFANTRAQLLEWLHNKGVSSAEKRALADSLALAAERGIVRPLMK